MKNTRHQNPLMMYTTSTILYGILAGCFFSLALLMVTIIFVPRLKELVCVMILTFYSLAMGFHIFRFLCHFFFDYMIFKFILNIILNLSVAEFTLLIVGMMWMFYNVIHKYLRKEKQRDRNQRKEENVITFIHIE